MHIITTPLKKFKPRLLKYALSSGGGLFTTQFVSGGNCFNQRQRQFSDMKCSPLRDLHAIYSEQFINKGHRYDRKSQNTEVDLGKARQQDTMDIVYHHLDTFTQPRGTTTEQ